MNKKLLLGLLAVLVIGLGSAIGFLWWTRAHQAPAPAAAVQAVTDIQNTVGSVNQRAVQDIYSNTNAAAAIPDVNPYKDTNPFSDVKTNPFE